MTPWSGGGGGPGGEEGEGSYRKSTLLVMLLHLRSEYKRMRVHTTDSVTLGVNPPFFNVAICFHLSALKYLRFTSTYEISITYNSNLLRI